MVKKNTLIIYVMCIGFVAYSVTMLIDGIMKLDVMIIATAILCVIGLWSWIYYANEVKEQNKEKLNKYKIHGPSPGATTYQRREVRKIDYKALSQLMLMDPFDFEKYIACIYKDLGYAVQLTRKTGDGGKDIILKKDGQTYYVECKRYKKPIDSRKMRDFIGACVVDGDHIKGIYVTTSSFTKDAVATANKKGIQLINGSSLDRLIKMAQENKK